jgi:Holliday junction resolvase RusA-like endonuclease
MKPDVIFDATIEGCPIVKKNTQKVSFRYGRPIKYNTAVYTRWEASAVRQLWGFERPGVPINVPVILLCTFFMQTRRRVDLSALYEGIQDVLVKTDILADDNSQIVIGHDGSRVLYDKERPRMRVQIIRT